MGTVQEWSGHVAMRVRLSNSFRLAAIGIMALCLSSCATSSRSVQEAHSSYEGITQDQALKLARKHVLDSGLGNKVAVDGFFMGPKIERWNIEACRDCWGVTFSTKSLSDFPGVYIVLIDRKTGEIRKAVWEE